MNNTDLVRKFWRTWVTTIAVALTTVALPACEAKSTSQTAKDLGLTDTSHLRSVSFVDQKHGWAVGIYGLVIATDDGGAHWQLQNVDTKLSLDSVHFIDAQHGWIVGEYNLILATEDGGKHWTQQDSPIEGAEEFNDVYFSDKLHGWIAGSHATLLTTVDGGQHWLKRTELEDARLWKLFFVNPKRGWATANDGVIAATEDGGANWKKQVDFSDSAVEKVFFTDSLHGWAAGDKGVIVATKDGGENWEKQNSATSADLLDTSFANRQTGWAIGQKGTVISTTDGGNHWQTQNSGTNIYLFGVSFVDAQHGWIVGDSATVLATTDGGITWQTQLSAKPPVKVEPQGKPKMGTRRDLTIVGYNYTNRYITQFSVDGEPGGDVHVSSESGGGGGMTCCMPYFAGGPAWVAKIRWDAKACTFDTRFDAGEKFNTIHHFFKTADVHVDPKVPVDPKYLEVHFYPDGHVEAAMTEELSPPRMSLSDDREDRSEFPQCPNDKEPND